MSQRILNHLDVHARFAHPGREGMPQGMAAETRQEYGAVRILRKHFIVAVPDDAPDGLVQRSLMLALTKAVDKDKVRVTVHRYRAMDLCFFLIGTFLFKGFFHEVHHRNSADTSLCFGRVAVEGVNEELKAVNQMEWVQRMNSIQNRAEEVIKNELIFV